MVRWQPVPRRALRWRRALLLLVVANEIRGLMVTAPVFISLFGWR